VITPIPSSDVDTCAWRFVLLDFVDAVELPCGCTVGAGPVVVPEPEVGPEPSVPGWVGPFVPVSPVKPVISLTVSFSSPGSGGAETVGAGRRSFTIGRLGRGSGVDVGVGVGETEGRGFGFACAPVTGNTNSTATAHAARATRRSIRKERIHLTSRWSAGAPDLCMAKLGGLT
jgi:hypothetical protein